MPKRLRRLFLPSSLEKQKPRGLSIGAHVVPIEGTYLYAHYTKAVLPDSQFDLKGKSWLQRSRPGHSSINNGILLSTEVTNGCFNWSKGRTLHRGKGAFGWVIEMPFGAKALFGHLPPCPLQKLSPRDGFWVIKSYLESSSKQGVTFWQVWWIWE